jgi:hypothetical protein
MSTDILMTSDERFRQVCPSMTLDCLLMLSFLPKGATAPKDVPVTTPEESPIFKCMQDCLSKPGTTKVGCQISCGLSGKLDPIFAPGGPVRNLAVYLIAGILIIVALVLIAR